MITSTDQLGRTIKLSNYAERIVSVVPSITELLFDIGLKDEVIGITKFCVHPDAWFRSKQKIGGTKNLNIQKIKDLQPDLIIANKEENILADIQQLENDIPVWVSDIADLDDVYTMINEISLLINKNENGVKLISKIKEGFNKLIFSKENRLTCAYLVWKNPLIAAGGDTFINEMLSCAGFDNIFDGENRYPSISIQKLLELKPRLILLSSEPFPFNEKHVIEFRSLFSNSNVLLVDGEMFSWYGSHLLKTPDYIINLISEIKHH